MRVDIIISSVVLGIIRRFMVNNLLVMNGSIIVLSIFMMR